MAASQITLDGVATDSHAFPLPFFLLSTRNMHQALPLLLRLQAKIMALMGGGGGGGGGGGQLLSNASNSHDAIGFCRNFILELHTFFNEPRHLTVLVATVVGR